MIIVDTMKEAKDIMKSIGLIKDDHVGERGRTYWKLPEEGIVCQSTITSMSGKKYLSFYGKHAELYKAKFG